jgi:hypothetical protein
MKVIFKKEHPAGIKKGSIHNVGKHIADRWIADGYVNIYDEEIVDVEKQKASSKTGGEASKKKQSKQSKSGKGKK